MARPGDLSHTSIIALRHRRHTLRFGCHRRMYRKITVNERAVKDSRVLRAKASQESPYFSQKQFHSPLPIYEYLKTAEWHFQSETTSGKLIELTEAYCTAIELDFKELRSILERLGGGLRVEEEPDLLFDTAQVVYSMIEARNEPYRAFYKSAAKKCFRASNSRLEEHSELTQGGLLAQDTRVAHRDAMKELKRDMERKEAARNGARQRVRQRTRTPEVEHYVRD